MANNIRRQLTLFIQQQDVVLIEKIRQQFNPVQSELIRAHVTLCRENEIEDLEKIKENLFQLSGVDISIEFGKVKRFDNNKGVLLPATANNCAFWYLRKQILFGITDNPGLPEPHITLIHPRNGTCTDNIFEQIEKASFPKRLLFTKISLIEQKDGGKWEILQEFE